MKKSVLVTGATGMLGSAVVRAWRGIHTVRATASRLPDHGWDPGTPFLPFSLESEDFSPLRDFCSPDVVVHCAAMTDHLACETNPVKAHTVNAAATGRLARIFPEARFLYVSTDAVFGSSQRFPDESVRPVPESVYGETKLEGEARTLEESADALVLRTTVVGLGGRRHTLSFAQWVLESLRDGMKIPLYTDAVFTPVNIWNFIDLLAWCVDNDYRGVLHAGGADAVSKYDFGFMLARHAAMDPLLLVPACLADAKDGVRRSGDQTLNSHKLASLRGSLPGAEACAEDVVWRFYAGY